MYSSKYSQVSKYSPEAQKRMQYRSRGKSCGYYMRIVFFFSSLIQSLIIISLVLFLIYGKKQDSASTSRIHDLEESFSRLSIENRELKQQRTNLTTLLNSTVTEKARNDWDLARLRDYTNISVVLFQDMEKKMLQCNGELHLCKARAIFSDQCPTTIIPENCHCGLQMERLKAKLELVNSNFTQTVQRMRMDMDQITKERDNLNLEAIRLRRDKSTHEKEVEFLKKKCKDDFSQSLSGVSNVTTAFLGKIDSLFLSYSPFQLTCPKQREHLEQIRTNCSSLSREVEDRFQRYLNNVGDQVSNILSQNSRLKAENWRLAEDYRWCSQNRTGLIQQHKQSQDKLQLKHDQDKEKLLVDKMKLHGQIEVLENNVNYKTKEVEHLVEQIKHLNMTCGSRGGFGGGFGGALQPRTNGGSSLPGFGQFNKPGSDLSSSAGSFGSSYNKPNNAAGSSSSSLSSSGYGSNKPASSGYGSSSSSLSSSGYGSNKPASSGYGSSSSSLSSSGSSNSGYGSNKPASSGYGSSSSSLSSSGSSNSGYGSNKPASSGYGSSSSSLSSSGSSNSGYGSNKPASSGYGSSSSSLSSPGSSSSLGSGSSKPASSGYGSLGSSSSSSSSSSSRGSSSLGSSSSSSAKSPSSSGSSSSGSSSSTGKSSSSSSGSWFNSWGSSSSSSSSGQSKTGTGSSKPASTGSGSSYGMGRTSGLTGGSAVSVAQHLRDLQRLINPAAPEEKQDLSRVLG